jgi:hypothetical protein
VTGPGPHELRLQLLAAAKGALDSVPGVIRAVTEDLEQCVGQLDVGTERLETARNNVGQVVSPSKAGGAIVAANTALESIIDTVHEALARCGDAQMVAAAAVIQLDRTIAQVRAAPNN